MALGGSLRQRSPRHICRRENILNKIAESFTMPSVSRFNEPVAPSIACVTIALFVWPCERISYALQAPVQCTDNSPGKLQHYDLESWQRFKISVIRTLSILIRGSAQ